MRTKLLVLLLTGVLSVLIAPTPVQAEHSWNGYHWARTSNPFTLKVGDNVDSKWDSYLNTTSVDWTKSSVADTPIVAGQAGNPRRCRATRGQVEVCNTTYGNNGWLGVASISVSGKHITAGTVKVNDTYFNTAAYNTPAWRNLVMCQEVGHTLGLGHNDENFDNEPTGTCMDYSNEPDLNQHPDQHDYSQLEAIYAHLDSTTTVGTSTSRGNAKVSDDAGAWGRQVSGSRASGHSTYVRDLGRGNLVITHVIWA